MNHRAIRRTLLALGTVLLAGVGFSQTNSQAQKEAAQAAKEIPSISADLGPCTADFTVTDPNGAPVFDAKIRVRIKYGFGNFHKLDLELGTNADGKARVVGLPNNLNHGLYFHAVKNDLTAEIFDDPSNTCKAQFPVKLEKQSQ